MGPANSRGRSQSDRYYIARMDHACSRSVTLGPRYLIAFMVIGALLLRIAGASAQAIFEPGSYLTSDGVEREGFILNKDWSSNPTEIRFRENPGATEELVVLEELRGFEIRGTSKYRRELLPVAPHATRNAQLARRQNPEYPEQDILLRILVEGAATLYEHKKGAGTNFYYSVGDGPVRRLLYNDYLDSTNARRTNMSYRRQLARDVSCEGASSDLPRYRRDELVAYFRDYGECTGEEVVDYVALRGGVEFRARIRPGAVISQFSIERVNQFEVDFGTSVGLRLGVDVEMVLPLRGGQYALFLEPTYISRSGTGEFGTRDTRVVDFEYRAIELPLGVRYYRRAGRGRVFADVAAATTVNFPTVFDFPNLVLLEAPATSFSAGLAVGYEYQERWSASARVQTGRNVLNGYSSWRANYPSATIMLGYRFL